MRLGMLIANVKQRQILPRYQGGPNLVEYAAKPNLPGLVVKTGGGIMLVNFFKGYTANIRHIKEKNV